VSPDTHKTSSTSSYSFCAVLSKYLSAACLGLCGRVYGDG
jgi:hypothetical protein